MVFGLRGKGAVEGRGTHQLPAVMVKKVNDPGSGRITGIGIPYKASLCPIGRSHDRKDGLVKRGNSP